MKSFKQLAETTTVAGYKKAYEILSGREKTNADYTADSSKEVVLDGKECAEIRDALYEEIKGNMVSDGIVFQSLEEAKKSARIVIDSFMNTLTGVGVQGFDPGSFNVGTIPVSMSPNDATAYYSSGGVPQIIIDKKSKGAILNGYHFENPRFDQKDLQYLEDYSRKIGFEDAFQEATRDGLIYGGSFVYPHFKQDTPLSYAQPLNKLVDDGILDKNCIDRFIIVDRWNTLVVPNTNLTARDYMFPDVLYIPLGGVRVDTSRGAMIRPKKLPYWGAIRQLGWGASDYEGYVKSIMAYNIIIASVPIMAQQMSLLVHEIPLDGIIAQNGVSSAEEFAKANSEKMRKWSMLNPVTVNSFGELKAINRQYTGYNDLIQSLRQDVGAQSGIPESTLFHTQATGFSDNVEDTTLKQSETIKHINNAVVPSFANLVKILVFSCFGKDSEQAKHAESTTLSFESPTVITNDEKSQLLEKFSGAVSMFHGSGMGTKDSVLMARAFIPEITLPEDVINSLDNEKEAPPEPPFGGPDKKEIPFNKETSSEEAEKPTEEKPE